MDTFEQFLTTRWRHSLARHRVLCIYDAAGRYRDIALRLAETKTLVIEVAGDVITGREQAMDAWRKLPEDASHTTALVLYIQRARPLDVDAQREDPFTPLALGGAVFPNGAGDEYPELCQQFLPEQTATIDELFAQDEPSIAVINGLISGRESSPALAELLKAQGSKEILVKFLCLAPAVAKKLKSAPHWLKELKTLATTTLGLTLHGEEVDVDEMRAQLWRYVLFSEFAADLPGGVLPDVIRKLQVALNRAADAGFHMAIITSDHGFCWFHEANAGSAISKPAGEWVQVKERSLLGNGQTSADVMVVEASHVGIRGDVPRYVAAKGLATFTKGVRYFHEGLSPQECV